MRSARRIFNWLFHGPCLFYAPSGFLLCAGFAYFLVRYTWFTVGQALLFCGSLYFLEWGLCILIDQIDVRRNKRLNEYRAREVNRALSRGK